MNVAKKIAGLFVFTLLSSTLWGVEGNKKVKQASPWVLPKILILEIFGYGDICDLAKASVACNEWNRLANSNQLWKILATKWGAERFKEDEISWKQAVQNWATIDRRVLNLSAWEKKELEHEIRDEAPDLIEKLLRLRSRRFDCWQCRQ